jgi:DHA2 family multidrug resistance protein-like MFS transporter
MDLLSAALSLGAVLSAIYGVKELARGGTTWPPALVAAPVLAALFVRRQRRLSHPMIDLSLFRSLSFSAALATNMLGVFAIFGVYVFLTQHLQLSAGLSPLSAAYWMLPSSAGFAVGSLAAPAIQRRVPAFVVIAGGLVLAAAGLVFLSQSPGLPGIAACSVAFSLGLSPVPTLATALVIGSAPTERAGAAAAVSETSSELGGALGIALLGSLGTVVYRAHFAGAPTGADTLAGAAAVASKLSKEDAASLLAVARHAFAHGFQVVNLVAAALLLIVATILIVLWRRSARGEREMSVTPGSERVDKTEPRWDAPGQHTRQPAPGFASAG